MQEERPGLKVPLVSALVVLGVLLTSLLYSWKQIAALIQVGNLTPLLISGRNIEESLFLYLLAAGALLSLLLAVIVFLLLATRRRAGALASRMTEELFSSRELFLELYRKSPVAYLLIDHDGIITFPNTAAVRLFGLTEEELEGKNIFKLFEGEDAEHIALLPISFQRNASIHNEEVQITTLGGGHRWALFSTFPFGRDGGKHKGLVTLADITKQKEIDRVKTEFVSLASHQLRTPISSLKWYAELLDSEKSGKLTKKQKDYLGKLERAIERMGTIVDDFLNVSRLELGTLEADLKPVDLAKLIDDILEEQAGQIDEKRLVIQKNYDERVTNVITDRHLLYMVLENIISNAVKYTHETGTIRVSYEGAGKQLIISVKDTGYGIPKDEQEKLFTKLFRASNVREQVPNGTGLGLYIAELTLKVLKGSITFTSELGKGTVFTVVLPN